MGLSRRKEALIGRLHRRKTREREGAFLVEGIRNAAEALDRGGGIRFAVAAPRLRSLEGGGALLERLVAAGVPVEEVDDDALAGLADTETPQGLLLVCDEPTLPLSELAEVAKRAGAGRILVLDGVQDPGNLGTLIRVAAAFGLDGVVALDGTVDPWNPKAVRAAAGGVFRVPVALASWTEVEGWLAGLGLPLLVAAASGTPVDRVEPPAPGWALAVGNEGAGPRPGVLAAAEARVAVPMPGGMESLNVGVAGAILLYALTRKGRHEA